MTKSAEAFGELLVRIEGEYREMPGLNLTVTQAERLWGSIAAHARQWGYSNQVVREALRISTEMTP